MKKVILLLLILSCIGINAQAEFAAALYNPTATDSINDLSGIHPYIQELIADDTSGNWSNNFSYASIHTQSTRISINNPEKNPVLARFVMDSIITNEKVVEIPFAKAKTLPPSVTVYDQVGRKITAVQVFEPTLITPVTSLSSGLYFITLDGQFAEPLKFVKTS